MKLLFAGFLFFSQLVLAVAKPEQNIRFAILDNLQREKLSSEKYEKDYIEGIEVAAKETERLGLKVEWKTFFYGKEPLAVLEKVKDVQAWNPDVVIGPRSSNHFLLLSDKLKGVLVVSPLATANEVSLMPGNFYSVSLPNSFAAQALVNYVNKNHADRKIFAVVEADCKNCVDFTDTFIQKYVAQTGRDQPKTSKFLGEMVERVDLAELLAGYEIGDLILLPNTSYASGILMSRIANHLKPTQEIIFLGGDGWGSWSSGYVGKLKSSFPYKGIRMTPWSTELNTPEFQSFLKVFKRIKNKDPGDNVAYVSYRAFMSTVEAYKTHKAKPKNNYRSDFLSALQEVRKSDPNWFRPTLYGVYALNQDGETFVGGVSALPMEKVK